MRALLVAIGCRWAPRTAAVDVDVIDRRWPWSRTRSFTATVIVSQNTLQLVPIMTHRACLQTALPTSVDGVPLLVEEDFATTRPS